MKGEGGRGRALLGEEVLWGLWGGLLNVTFTGTCGCSEDEDMGYLSEVPTG